MWSCQMSWEILPDLPELFLLFGVAPLSLPFAVVSCMHWMLASSHSTCVVLDSVDQNISVSQLSPNSHCLVHPEKEIVLLNQPNKKIKNLLITHQAQMKSSVWLLRLIKWTSIYIIMNNTMKFWCKNKMITCNFLTVTSIGKCTKTLIMLPLNLYFKYFSHVHLYSHSFH